MKNRGIWLLLFLCLQYFAATAQQYVAKQYAFRVDSNIVYASDTNYLGYPENVYLHLYKPIGDANTQRPILIYIHGGSWLGGTPNDYYPKSISEEFAKRGYVVANIQYRMGMHTNPAITPGINCSLIDGAAKCAYVADSLEVLRASFRAMQDAKSAIRFMKNRSIQDSTCAEAVFLSGESAGAITALGAAFLDKNSERFTACSSQTNAPVTNSALSFCQNLLNHLPAGQSPNYNRPDLGPVEGRTNLNGFSSGIKGVAAFYGAVFSEALSKNWLNGPDTPYVYLFHQGNDFVVSCGPSAPLVPMNQCIPYVNLGFNDCVGFSNLPLAYGSCSVASYFQSLNYNKFSFEFVNNYLGNPLLDCINTAQAGQGHNIDNISLRCDSIAKLFSPLALQSIQNCQASAVFNNKQEPWIIYPNPFTNEFHLQFRQETFTNSMKVLTILGKEVPFTFEHNTIQLLNVPPAVYFLTLESNQKKYFARLVKLN